MNSRPTVSVVIPTYNRTDLLPRAIDSVLNQTYTNLECIVVDGASAEDTQSVIDEYEDKRLRYFEREQNKNASAGRNTGIEHSHGEYIAFLDDDDEWLPTKIEKQLSAFSRVSSDVGIVYCWMDYIKQSGELVREYRPEAKGYIFPEMLDGQRIGNSSTLLVRSEAVEKVDGFDESLSRGDDGDFIRRICKKYEVNYVPEVLVKYYVHHGHKRLTNSDPQGIRNAIHGEKIKFEKFGEELQNHPDRASNIYLQIADHYTQLRDWQNVIKYYIKAISTNPTNTSVFPHIFNSAKSIVSL